MLLGGELAESAGGGWIDSVNPATEDYIGKVPRATTDDVERAVAAAEKAQRRWGDLSVARRSEYLLNLCDAILARADEILSVEVADSGNPITAMKNDIVGAVNDVKYFAGLGYEVKGESMPATVPKNFHFTVREPSGVVGRILSFNHPIYLAISGMAAPLVAGNSVILKPSEHTSLSASILAEIASEILPPGVLSILTGDFEAGNALVRHPRVKRLSFVGSVATGMAIQRAAAEVAVKHVSLELGGKNPFIAFPDAPLDKVAAAAVAAMNFSWQGQSCSSTGRLFLHDSIYDEVVERILAAIGTIRIGDPFDPATQMGAINSKPHLTRIRGHIEAAQSDGARLLAGGSRPAGTQFEKGYWCAPTVFGDVQQGMRIAREEVFGPVLSALRWTDVDDVLEQANCLQYGLTGVIWTNDITSAMSAVRKLQAGHVWVNGVNAPARGMPYGRYKNSGVGREHGMEELLSYTEEKAVNIMLP